MINNDRPGAFELGDVILVSYRSFDGSDTPKRLDIRNLLTEFNIYESIDGNFLSGDMTLLDATNAIQELPITGFERIEFFLRTPGTTKGFDFSIKSGHPMFVYSLKNRQGANPRSQVYTLKFTSLEAIRNHQTRVSQAFVGPIDQMIVDVCKDYLHTKKDVLVEETKELHKFVSPRVKPMKLINHLRKESQALHFENSGFNFFETAMGFQFKSYEGLFCRSDGSPRPVKAHYTPKIKNAMISGDNGKEIYDLQSVESFRVLSQFDTLANTANGVYASRIITHDAFNKTFEETDFDYNIEYEKQNHLEQDSNGDKQSGNGILPYFNYDKGDTFGTKNEGVIHYTSQTSNIHDSYELPLNKNIIPKRVSQHLAINSLKIEITIPGTTEVNAGDIVHFAMPKYAPYNELDKKDQDVYLTGRYLISAARHHVSALNKRHTLVLELIKDSFNTSYPDESIDLFTNNENDQGEIYIATEVDKHT